MKLIRKILVKIIGIKAYLQLISKIYILLMRLGFFKKKYAELHFVKELVQSNDTVLDIGANLGYYSYFLAKKIQPKGQLIAVEPIPLFADIWKSNMRKWSNKVQLNLFNIALGEAESDNVKMSIPIVNGVVRHGLTKVDENNVDQAALSFEVPMKIGDNILEGLALEKLNFIKCDVEGYEQFVMPSLIFSIEKFSPVIQIELNGKENKQNVTNFLTEKDYHIHVLQQNKLKEVPIEEIHIFNQDFYFIHASKLSEYKTILN